MTTQAPVWFEQKYIAGAIHVLQAEGNLTAGMARKETNIKGITVEWKIAGRGSATVMSQTPERRPVMNAGRSIQTATMVDYEANEEIQITDIEKMTESEQQVAQETAGMAMGRRTDQVFFGAMDAEGANILTVGDGTRAISPVDIIQTQATIAAQGINGTHDWYCALPSLVFGQLMLYREFVNSQYVGDLPLMKKIGARTWLGVTCVPMPDEYFASPAAGILDGYLWMKDCHGFCTNYDLKSRIDYIAREKTWFAANTMGMASKTLLNSGIRRMRFLNTAPYVRPNP